jgi:hypothetical protein
MSETTENIPPVEEGKKSQGSKRTIIIILLLLLLGSIGYNFVNQQKNKAAENVLVSEKLLLMKELGDLKKNYEVAMVNNANVSEELSLERDKVLKMMDELKKSQMDLAELRKYRAQTQELKLNLSQLIAENEMLKALNSKLKVKVDSSMVELGKSEIKTKTLDEQVKTLSKTVEKGAVVKPLNLEFQGVAQRLSSKTKREAFTNRANKTKELKICFTLPENKLAKKGDMHFYVQINNPKNNIMGLKETVYFEGKSLTYTFEKIVKYDNEAVDVCEYVNVSLMKFEPGKYTAQLFLKGDFISKVDLEMK